MTTPSGELPLLTISELARFAGVTVRAVRHYHARGLLPEPGRDDSGYRRYDAQAAVDLIRIRTLAEAGVPLARVGELLQAGDVEFAGAVDDIDRRLRTEIERLSDHRARIARLAAGDSLALPVEVVRYLQQLREIGISERGIAAERDAWILVAAHMPDEIVGVIGLKAEGLADPLFREIYRSFDQAADWDPADPRLADLADVMSDYIDRQDAEQDQTTTRASDHLPEFDRRLVALLESQENAAPAWRRLRALLAERGHKGWTTAADED
jgi:DNA-binding transcriptional MerR regulator